MDGGLAPDYTVTCLLIGRLECCICMIKVAHTDPSLVYVRQRSVGDG